MDTHSFVGGASRPRVVGDSDVHGVTTVVGVTVG